ncbi:MAG: acetyl-CoA carboxylase biotin carboxyl carrier protein subunit [Desulfobacteraceae bacterium]|nr:acetyl-CoA carboxylase biotin carboxyl carrier protein subunit [Desulfobacteraceae bacterium]MCF8095399.1 acetyl-CoA carboxylase biotin carboxyl carrier protein subunit [Desulfobacteraceae bacterium]
MAEEIKAPLAGKVINVLVETGDTVEEDDEVVILEAMKMETSVYASGNGTVKEVKVKPGDEVEEDTVLLTME